MDWTFWVGTTIFLCTYILIATEKIHKVICALGGAALMFIFVLVKHQSAEPLTGDAAKYAQLDVYARYVNFDVIFTLCGMMILVNILSTTGLFQYVAIKCAKLAKGSPLKMLILLSIATAFMSAFLDNVTTILLVAPVTLLVCAELGVSAIPFLMAETLSSNIGGTATLIGDPPNLIIGSVAKLDFAAFIINLSPVIVLIMALYMICLWLYYRKRLYVTIEKRARIMELDEKAAITDAKKMRNGLIIMVLTIVGFLLHSVTHLEPGVVAMTGAAAALAVCKVDVEKALEKVEWVTLFFFLGLFVLVSGARECGLIACVGDGLKILNNVHPVAVILIVMWVCGAAAAVTNNVSFTAAVVSIIGLFMQNSPAFSGNPVLCEIMWWALALSVCLGGNGSLVGAAANLVAVGMAEKGGCKLTFCDFLRYGLPVTLGSMLVASAYIVIRYACQVGF
ncbi:MAG: ArsB/NhaD family transporter [Lentisphaeria bacterium]|nr:ArsB/NhaD family transporter [Lentisphaeria bacterium]